MAWHLGSGLGFGDKLTSFPDKERNLFAEDQKTRLVPSALAEDETAPSTDDSADEAFEDKVEEAFPQKERLNMRLKMRTKQKPKLMIEEKPPISS